MITLICTKCRASLEIDDGFAGGACRCQHCGTIQTVPSHLKTKKRPANPIRSPQHQSQQKTELRQEHLNDPAQIAASSGLASKRLREKAPATQKQIADEPGGSSRRTSPAWLVAAVVIALLVVVAIVIAYQTLSPKMRHFTRDFLLATPGKPSCKSLPVDFSIILHQKPAPVPPMKEFRVTWALLSDSLEPIENGIFQRAGKVKKSTISGHRFYNPRRCFDGHQRPADGARPGPADSGRNQQPVCDRRSELDGRHLPDQGQV